MTESKKYQCPCCGYEDGLIQKGEIIYLCPLCHKVFTLEQLNRHLTMQNEREKICNINIRQTIGEEQ